MGTDKLCKLCGNSMVQVGKKLVCTNNECSYVELMDGKIWYMNIADDLSYWNESIMNKAPSIIACEYHKLYCLFKKGAVHAFPLKIKDIFEVEIKFLTLIKLSKAFHNNEYKKSYADMLFTILNSPPSMGTWVAVAQNLVSKEKSDVISHQLSKILKICFKYNIVNWRNNTIGHGALYVIESHDFQMDIIEKMKVLSEYYDSSADTYKSISLFVKGAKKKDTTNLVGYKDISHKKLNQGKMFISYENNTFELLPLVRYISNEMYLYDSYDYRRGNATFLSYNIDRKIREKDITVKKMYEYLKLDMNLRATNVSVDEDFINVSRLSNIDAVICPRNIINISSLADYYNKILATKNKGIFFIQMEDGMGKTTFVKMLDTLSYYHGKQTHFKDEGHMVRAVYINSLYGYKPRYFITEIIQALRTTNEGELISGDIPAIDIFDDDAKTKFIKFLDDIYDYNKKNNNIKKLVLFIDGIDEIPYMEGRTVLEIIPHASELNSGIYIFVTARNSGQLTKFTKESIIPKLNFDEEFSISSSDENYRNDLKNGVMKYLRNDNVANKILELAQNKIINIEYIIQAYQYYGMNDLEKWVGIDGFWKFKESTYGEQYYNELKRMAFVLAIVPVPISVTLLARLLGEEHVTFKLFTFLGELKQFVSSQRNANGTMVIISRSEVREFLNTHVMQCSIEKEWMQHIGTYKDIDAITEEDAQTLGIIVAASMIYGFGDANVLKEAVAKYIAFIMGNINTISKWIADLNLVIFDIIIDRVNTNSITKFFSPDQIMLIIYAFANQMEIGGDTKRFIEGAELVIEKFEGRINLLLCQRVYRLLGEAYSKINEDSKAEQYIRKASDSIGNLALTKGYDYLNSKDCISLMEVETLLSEAIMSKNNEKYNNSTKFNKTIKILKKASALIDKIFPSGENDVGYCVFKANILQVYGNVFKQDNPDKALHYFEECYRLQRLISGEESLRGSIMSCMNIGQVYRALNDYKKADDFYEHGLSIINEAEAKGVNTSVEDKAALYNSKANLYRDQNDNNKALSFYSMAIDLLEREIDNGKNISKRLYSIALAGRMDIYERLHMTEEYKKDGNKLMQYYGKKDIIPSTKADYLHKRANDDISRGRIKSALERLEKAITLNSSNPKYFFDYAYCFSEINDNKNAAINTLKGLNLVAPTYRAIQRGECKIGAVEANDENNDIAGIIDIQTINTYSMYLYLSRIGEYSRAVMHFLYGWYLEAHSINIGHITIPADKPGVIGLVYRKDMYEYIRKLMNKAIKKGKIENNTEYGEKLLRNAIRLLDNKELSDEDISDTFLKWIPGISSDELRQMKNIYSYDMVAFEMMNRALEYGNINALAYIRDFYSNSNYFAYDKVVAEKLFAVSDGIVHLR